MTCSSRTFCPLTLLFRAILTVGIMQCSVEAQQCTMQEEQRWWTITGQFSIGTLNVNVTIPAVVRRATTAYLEVQHSESSTANFFLENGEERIGIANGAELHLTPASLQRLTITVKSDDNRTLCMWRPSLRRQSPDAQTSERTGWFSRIDSYRLRRVGEPISLNVGRELVNRPADFQLDGTPAMVLCRNSLEVVLRDPAPTTGTRAVTSHGHSITLRFIDIDTHLSSISSNGAAVLTVRVPQLILWGRHLWPRHFREMSDATAPYLALLSLHPDRTQLLCGKDRTYHPGAEFTQFREVRITQDMIANGSVSVNCKVHMNNLNLADLHVDVFEGPLGSLSRSAFPF